MAKWPKMDAANGVFTTELKSWREFHDIVAKTLDYSCYSFRGQRMSNWLLEPSLARIIKNKKARIKELMAEHLLTFQLASRGRRGTNPPPLTTDNDWWALGQHHGLATPLLDWTSSPYVALFFALAEPPSPDQTDYCVVFTAHRRRIELKNSALNKDDPFFTDEFEFFQPRSDENSRLVAQSGLFSRSPIGTDVESWVSTYFKGEENKITLLKVLIPYSERIECLKALHVMNLNYATLFPDLYGAGKLSTELLRRATA
jgi:hypothetical protein